MCSAADLAAVSRFLEGEGNREYFFFQDGHEEPEPSAEALYLSINGLFEFLLDTRTKEVSSASPELSPWCEKLNAWVKASEPKSLVAVLEMATTLCRELSFLGSTFDEEENGGDEDEHIYETQEPRPSKSREEMEKDREFEEYVESCKQQGMVANKQATSRILADLRQLWSCGREFGFHAEPFKDNLLKWNVRFFNFEKGTGLYNDMLTYQKRTGKDYLEFQMIFPEDYPFRPPFIRAVRPRFAFHTGHITIGGSVCMELLTMSGWTAANSVESVLVQLRTEIVLGGGRLDLGNQSDYTEDEARSAFARVAAQHGWKR
eukprot:RCo010875